MITVLILAFLQTVTFAINSRARNRGHTMYNFWATALGNVMWFLCFREVALDDWNLTLLLPYVAGAAFGSVAGVWIAEKIERFLNASADGHLK